MELYSALNDFKRFRDDPRRFPGERRSVAGLFSGLGDRLVHVAPDGSIRDYSYPLSGRAGIERSRFGVELGADAYWCRDGDQRYVEDTAVVETHHEADDFDAGESAESVPEDLAISRVDLTLDRAHLSHVSLPAGFEDARLRACIGFAPEGRVGRVGQLSLDGAVEVFHDRERDYVTASTALESAGQVPERLDELIEETPTVFPRGRTGDRYEEAQLSGIVLVDVPLSGSPPSATLVTLLTDGDLDRSGAVDRGRELASTHDSREAVIARGRRQADERLPASETYRSDFRVLDMLRSSSGARIAGPEFDPFYLNSGGYGYTWFRDDAEIAGFLLAADRRADLGLDAWHEASARFYADAQLPDGTWPHRVWPHSGRLAPGWANGRIETGSDADYQADQTASTAAFLATYLRVADPDLDVDLVATVERALDGLDDSLADDGLPVSVQNAWENATGRFTHTAATFLEAYAAIARAPVSEACRERATEAATTVYDALDRLWVEDRGRYGMRLADGSLDDRLDGSTLALAGAHAEYDAVVGVDADRLERLVEHGRTTIDGLSRDPAGPVEGLARFEDDAWRRRDQADPKIWSVTTAWGANAAVELRDLLAAHDHDGSEGFGERARDLLALVEPGGTLRRDGDYLPEQVFDDGTPDSATPLGWPHAIRIATATAIAEPPGVQASAGDATVSSD